MNKTIKLTRPWNGRPVGTIMTPEAGLADTMIADGWARAVATAPETATADPNAERATKPAARRRPGGRRK